MRLWTYYLVWLVLAYGLRQPLLLLGILLLLLFRDRIPVPSALFRALGRVGRLKRRVEANPADVIARRDLALLYMDLLRPRAALKLMEQARARHPDDPELLLFTGLALHECGRHEEALEPLVRSVELDPALRFGMTYFVAGNALLALRRYEAALDSFERYVALNGSDLAGYAQLARAHAGHREPAAAKKAIYDGLQTWRVVPAWMRRKSIGRWLDLQWARVWMLREPAAALAWLAVTFAAGLTLYGVGVGLRHAWNAMARGPSMDGHPDRGEYGLRGPTEVEMAACGRQSTGELRGHYEFVSAPYVEALAAQMPADQRKRMIDATKTAYDDFEVTGERIRIGANVDDLTELCITEVSELKPDRLVARAIYQDRNLDSSERYMVDVRLEREGDTHRFRWSPVGVPITEVDVVLRRRR